MQPNREDGFGAGGFGGGFGNGDGDFGGGGFGGGFGNGGGGFGAGGFGGGFGNGGDGGGNGFGGFGGDNDIWISDESDNDSFDGRDGFGGEDVFGGAGFGHEGNRATVRWRGRVLSQLDMLSEFGPEYTDEKRDEWLKWIDERSKRYSIEPVIIKRFTKQYLDNKYTNVNYPDMYVYCTEYGTLEVQEQFVENFVTKPVDVIMRARGRSGPLVIHDREIGDSKIISATDPPTNTPTEPQWNSWNPWDPPKKDVFYLMDLFVNQTNDYTSFCQDLYDNYRMDMARGYSDLPDDGQYHFTDDIISFDDITDELCLKLNEGLITSGGKLKSFKTKKLKPMVINCHSSLAIVPVSYFNSVKIAFF